MMLPMTVVLGALVVLVLTSRTRSRSARVLSPLQRLDERLAAGDIGVEEHRARRIELEHRV